jgi:hypothetical protein
LLVETSELSFEPVIEGRFDRSICVVPSGVAKKYVDTFLEAPNTQEKPAAVLSGQARTVRGPGPDGPRPGVRRWCSLVRRGRSAAQGRTVRGTGPDGPRLGAGARVPCLTAGRSAPWGRTVRAYTGAAKDRRRRMDLAPGRDPSGRRDPRSCLGSDRPT